MDAEPAATPPGVTGGKQPNDSEQRQQRGAPSIVTYDDHAAAGENVTGSEAPVSGRLGEILDLMGKDMPEELRESLRTEEKEEKGKTPEEQEQEQDEEPEKTGEELTAEERKEWPEEALNRIHKKTAQLETEREQHEATKEALAQREEELAILREQATQAPPLPVTQDNVLVNVNSAEELARVESELEHIHEWTVLNPQGGDYEHPYKDKDGQPIVQTFDETEARRIRIAADKALRKAVPARQQFLAQRSEFDSVAREDFPEVFDGKSEAAKLATKVLKTVPVFAQFPDGMIHLGLYTKALLEYQKQRQTKANGNGKTDPAATASPKVRPFLKPQAKRASPLPSVEHSRSTAPRTDPNIKAAADAAMETGGDERSILDLVTTIRNQGAQNRSGRAAA